MIAVDKYEYKLKTEQMLELMEDGSYKKAAEIADAIDWKRVRNAAMLTNVSDIYEKNKEYEKSYNVLNLAYHRAEGSRKIISKLCTLALKTGNVDEAIDFYDDFMQIAPKDPNQYILRYQILRAQRAPIEQQIEALEEYKKSEYIEEWAYELAKLYQEAGMTAECLEECDDLILWFSEGQYVYKAMELKMQYKPLTPSQQEKYDKRYEKLSAETEEMPDIATYAGEAEQEEDANAEDVVDDTADNEDVRTADIVNMEDTTDADGVEVSVADTESENDSAAVEITEENTVKKKKIGNTMPLDEALRQLLHPERTTTDGDMEDEPELDDLEQAIGEIESVADMDIVNEIAVKKKKASSAGEMTEIIPDEDEQIEGQMNLEDILTDWEGEPDSDAAEDLEEGGVENLTADEAEELFEGAGEDLIEEAAEVLPEEVAEELPDDAVEELPDDATEELPDDAMKELLEKGTEAVMEGDDPTETEAEEIVESEPESEVAVDLTDTDKNEGENNGETMEDNITKKTEPILPPDIQRLIDEIEGVIPPQEETEPKPVKRTLKKNNVPLENMGKVADSLRIDDADLEEDEEYFGEEAEDLDEDEEYFEEEAEDLDEDEEYFEEEAEDLDEDEEYFEEEAEDLDEDEEYFEEEAEDLDEDEEYFEEEAEDLDEDEEYFEEEAEDLDEDEEYFEEEAEDLDEDEEYFEEDAEDEIDFDEEFRVNPEHADIPDDREIPDDDDDNMDILSSTKPLSRKETAKMIATGKTAPLPLDEISDALSMTDTGFIVHGRYDLEMQSGIGTRAGLTEEQKKLFSYFVPVRGMSEQLVDVLEQDKNCTNRQGTSRTGNLLIVGNKGNGKTVLAVDVVKAIQKQRNIRQGKVAIVTGDSLNKKKISDIFDKLYGGALIIEKAGKMNERTVARLNKAMEKDTGELLIVLEEQRKPIDRLLSSNREFRRKFTSRLEVPIFINDELVTFGQTYAQENGYRIDEMGILALYSKIDSLQREDHAVTVAEVKGIMDDAIQHSQKASAKKLVKRVFGKNTDESDRILLSENDFNI